MHPTRIGSERGAAAVEFALVFPALILILLGIVEFGFVFNAQIQLTSAAREGVRELVVTGDAEAARAATVAAGVGLDPAIDPEDVALEPANCAAGGTVELTIDYDKPLLTGLFGMTIPLTGTAVRACGG